MTSSAPSFIDKGFPSREDMSGANSGATITEETTVAAVITGKSWFNHLERSLKMPNDDYDKFALGDWHLQCGATLSNAHIAYKTFGDPKAPAIVYPTWYSGCAHA